MTRESQADGSHDNPAAGSGDSFLGDVRIPAHTPALFFDAASGLPPAASTVRWLTVAFESAWADPAGRHGPAAMTRAVLDQAKAQFAEWLSCRPQEIWFAPTAETALVTALDGICAGSPAGLPVVASPIERLAVLHALESRRPHLLAVDATGLVEVRAPAAGRPAAALLVQAANREIGTMQPLAAIAAARHRGVPLVVDATAVRSPAQLPQHWDVLVLQPVMWGGPDGIAVVAARSSVPWLTTAPATAAQRYPGRVSAALAAAAAMSLPGPEHVAEDARLHALVERLAHRLLQRVPHVVRLGHPQRRLDYLLAVSMLYVNAEQLIDDLTARGFAVHSGSACTAETKRPSHVLTAIGALTSGNLRISLPPGSTVAETDALCEAIAGLVEAQRAEAGVL